MSHEDVGAAEPILQNRLGTRTRITEYLGHTLTVFEHSVEVPGIVARQKISPECILYLESVV